MDKFDSDTPRAIKYIANETWVHASLFRTIIVVGKYLIVRRKGFRRIPERSKEANRIATLKW